MTDIAAMQSGEELLQMQRPAPPARNKIDRCPRQELQTRSVPSSSAA